MRAGGPSVSALTQWMPSAWSIRENFPSSDDVASRLRSASPDSDPAERPVGYHPSMHLRIVPLVSNVFLAIREGAHVLLPKRMIGN